MDLDSSDIERYLQKVRICVSFGWYELSLNPESRPENHRLAFEYYVGQTEREKIFAGLTWENFCKAEYERNVIGEADLLYFFEADVKLRKKGSSRPRKVTLYIKTKLVEGEDGTFCFVISFHEESHPMKRFFDETHTVFTVDEDIKNNSIE